MNEIEPRSKGSIIFAADFAAERKGAKQRKPGEFVFKFKIQKNPDVVVSFLLWSVK